jgi:hypothetical protein
MELKKRITKEEVIELYKKNYKEKRKLTEKEEESFLQWILIDKLKDEIEEMKPLVMGGYPKFLYRAVTPFYNIIAYTFILVGISLTLISISGFYISSQRTMIGYLLPSILSLFFGIIILLFLRTLKVSK